MPSVEWAMRSSAILRAAISQEGYSLALEVYDDPMTWVCDTGPVARKEEIAGRIVSNIFADHRDRPWFRNERLDRKRSFH